MSLAPCANVLRAAAVAPYAFDPPKARLGALEDPRSLDPAQNTQRLDALESRSADVDKPMADF
jgi:hypothetical protein